jgi:hypothetical protein
MIMMMMMMMTTMMVTTTATTTTMINNVLCTCKHQLLEMLYILTIKDRLSSKCFKNEVWLHIFNLQMIKNDANHFHLACNNINNNLKILWLPGTNGWDPYTLNKKYNLTISEYTHTWMNVHDGSAVRWDEEIETYFSLLTTVPSAKCV